MELVKYYNKEKMELEPLTFLRDVVRHVKVREMDGYERTKQIVVFLADQAEKAGGLEIPSIYKQELKELIERRYKSFSMNELYYAFKMDRFGEFGDPTPHYNNFSTQYVTQVLRKYSEWRQKMRFNHNIPIAVRSDQSEPEYTEKEKKLLIHNGILDEFDHYENAKMVRDGKVYIFGVLGDLGEINPTLSAEDIDGAIQFLKDTAMMQASDENWQQRTSVKRLMAELEDRTSSKIHITAKKLAIGKYFRSTNRKDLDKLLTEKL